MVESENAGDTGDEGSIPGSGGSFGGGTGNPLKYSCLENPTDRSALQSTVHGVAEHRMQLSNEHSTWQVKCFVLCSVTVQH